MTVDQMKTILSNARESVSEERRLGNDQGTQLKVLDASVNIYDKGTYNVQGKRKATVEALINSGKKSTATPWATETTSAATPLRRKVFVVYGHDEMALTQLRVVLHGLKFEPIVLKDQPPSGETIIEKLEDSMDADFACVLLTPDDFGYRKDQPQNTNPRARQNVVLELGMVLAKLGRHRVAILVKDHDDGPIERPTDIEGLVYLSFRSQVKEVQTALAQWLNKLGFPIEVSDLQA